ncbi:MAG: rhomboid family intramembrane serine protease [Deltaproteobacteria bacterium]|nr:rhomboid family intramembrane serine protease [Deltaproteobacteria bacterium]
MIPIRDTTGSRNHPVVNTTLIGINVALFLIQLQQGPKIEQFVFTYGLVPARYTVPEIAFFFTPFQQILAFFSFMFLHGGFMHLLGNMWSLYIFGDNVEDRLGPLRYLVFYFLCGWFSGLTHFMFNMDSRIPTIGASGAIAGVMGAYLILFPSAKILTFIPIFFIPYFVEIPAFIFLGIWFLIQFLSATALRGNMAGIAWWAHVGGFLAGIVFVKLLLMVPQTGLTRGVRSVTLKHKTPRLQVIHTLADAQDPHLYGSITITPREAAFGTRKLVNIPWGFHSRVLRVAIPPGVKKGTTLRLRGLGKTASNREVGDLLLKVLIKS